MRIEENTPDRRGRSIDVTLRQTKQRQSRLWLTSALVRARVGLFGLGELTPKSMDLAEPIERRTHRWPGHQERTRVLRVARGITPVTMQLQDFGAVECSPPIILVARLHTWTIEHLLFVG